MLNKVVGGNIMIISDLHFSDIFKGRHKDYLTECFGILGDLTARVNSKKPSAIVLLGDIVGWQETNVRNREVFSMLCRVFKEWNSVCPVYAVRGNHDMEGYPDFQFLADFGLIITSEACGGYFDYYGTAEQEVPEVRYHLVNYGEESRHLDLAVGTTNIVLAHNNFKIDGVTNWYYSKHAGINLGMHSAFDGVSMVISGHIHNPSPEIVSVQMPDGGDCMLLYPGCPTRPQASNDYDYCWLVYIGYNGTATDIVPERLELKPLSEVMESDSVILEAAEADKAEEALRKEALKDILDDLMKYRISSGSPIDQIKNIPNASEGAKRIAVEYLQLAYGGI